MKVTFKKNRFTKVTIELPDYALKLCHELGFSVEEILREIFIKGNTEFEGHSEDEIKELEKKINEVEKRLYELEGSWSSLRFKLFQISSDNRNLAIQISGLIAENRRLRRMLNLPERNFEYVEEIIKYYLNIDSRKEQKVRFLD